MKNIVWLGIVAILLATAFIGGTGAWFTDSGELGAVTFTMEEQEEEGVPVDVRGFGTITSHAHKDMWWNNPGIRCLTADQSGSGDGYVQFKDNFFNEYIRVTIEFKSSGNFYYLTLTENGVESTTIPEGVTYNSDKDRYDFHLDGGGQAKIYELFSRLP